MNNFYVYMYMLLVKEAYSWIKHISIIRINCIHDWGSWEHVHYGTSVKYLYRQIALAHPYIITDAQNKT